jgi:hypothetical protein
VKDKSLISTLGATIVVGVAALLGILISERLYLPPMPENPFTYVPITATPSDESQTFVVERNCEVVVNVGNQMGFLERDGRYFIIIARKVK